ncbi:MAG TPA: DUF2834 domain-containing protein [Candidatus Binatia bacterium]
MSWKKVLLAVVLADFSFLTAYAVWQVGYVGFFAEVTSTWSGITCAVDLVIALGLIATWMVRDARQHGISPLPYLVLTATLGSVGPLLYLLRRPEPATEPSARLVVQAS